MQDMDLAFQMNQLGQNLRSLAPQMPWDEPWTWAASRWVFRRVSIRHRPGQSAGGARGRARSGLPGRVVRGHRRGALRETLGDEAARDLRRLRQIEKMLEDAGVIVRSSGRLELTPRGVRKLGERALTRVFERLSDGPTGLSRDLGGWRRG
jgi:hypothetical protein